MDIEQLRTLVTVVDEGTFDRAAARLHVSAPAVSQRIKALETQTGHVLVQRVVPVRLTEPGTEVLRLARQVLALHNDAMEHLGLGGDPNGPGAATGRRQLPVAVNADSLATWFRPVLAEVGSAVVAPGQAPVTVRLSVEDQDHSLALLQAGTVAAAVTTSERTVTGCRSIALGEMVYEPCLSATLLDRLTDQADGRGGDKGSTDSALDLSVVPVVVFNDKDDLQHHQLRRVQADGAAPEHRVPSSEAFIRAVADGLGWGMVPRLQMARSPFAAVTEDFARVPGLEDDTVTLFLQRWKTPLPALDRLEASVRKYADMYL